MGDKLKPLRPLKVELIMEKILAETENILIKKGVINLIAPFLYSLKLQTIFS